MRRCDGGLLLLVCVMVASAGPVRGGDTLKAPIPFDFHAGDQDFQKGNCTIDLSTGSRVSVQCSGTRTAVQAQTLAFQGSVYEVAGRKEMTFTRYGEPYFLSTIWIADEGRELLRSAAEKELIESGTEGAAVKLEVK